MLSLLRKIRRILHRNKWKNTGKVVEILNAPLIWIGDRLSTFIGACERAKEVVLFVPVIFKTVRWDYSSIWHILHHWMSRMQDVHAKDIYHTRAEKNARDLKEVVLLLERLKKCEYEENAYIEHDKRWGELSITWTPCEYMKGYSQAKFNRSNIKTKRDKEIERKEFLAAAKHADYQKKQDIERLFILIKKHYGKWWV